MSGMQTFAGEDLKYEKRRQLQQEQIRFSLSHTHTHALYCLYVYTESGQLLR